MLPNLFRKNIPRWPTQRHFADVAERRADAIVAPSRRYSILVAEANPAKQEVVQNSSRVQVTAPRQLRMAKPHSTH